MQLAKRGKALGLDRAGRGGLRGTLSGEQFLRGFVEATPEGVKLRAGRLGGVLGVLLRERESASGRFFLLIKLARGLCVGTSNAGLSCASGILHRRKLSAQRGDQPGRLSRLGPGFCGGATGGRLDRLGVLTGGSESPLKVRQVGARLDCRGRAVGLLLIKPEAQIG